MLTSGSFKRTAIVQEVEHVPEAEAGSALLHDVPDMLKHLALETNLL